MFLQAVSICINYADFLEAVVANRRHFDRWVVVTCAEDVRTRELCARHGMECMVSAHLQPDGKDFHAVDAKWHVINEGLDALDPEGWALVLDADVLLPRHFRERLAALPLEPGCLYGAAGRKVLDEREAFEQLRACEPWTTLVARNSNIIGYFNLFSLEATPNRYARRKPGDRGGAHDDYRFAASFDDDHRQFLPMTVIHAGWPGVNWGGRTAPAYEGRKHPTSNTEHPTSNGERAGCGFNQSLITDHQSPGNAAMVGYFPGGRWLELAQNFTRVWLVDHFQVHAPSGHPLWEADRTVLRRLFVGETAGMTHLELLGAHSVQNLAKIPDGSLDLLYLPGEVAPDWLTTALRHWRPKLRDGAVVCGDLYGLPHWREATFSLSLLLGPPDGVDANGFWWKRMRAEDWKLAAPENWDENHAGQDGVVLINRTKETLEKLLLTLHSVSRHWSGAAAVYHWGEEDPSLTIACGRLGVELWNVGEADEEQSDAEWVEEVAAIQTFHRALLLQPGMLAVGPLVAAFDSAKAIQRGDDAIPHLVVRGETLCGARAVSAERYQDGASEPILVCTSDPGEWTEAAWEAWSINEAEMAQAMAVEVRVAADATVVALVEVERAGDFQRNWLTWRFPAGTPVLVVLIGIAVNELWLPGLPGQVRLVSLSPKQADDLPWLLGWLSEECKTPRIVFLPATAAALPGSELWCGEAWSHPASALHWSSEARKQEALIGNRFLPEPFFGMVKRSRLAEIAEGESPRGKVLRDLPLVIHEALHADSAETPSVDMKTKGWRSLATHLYIPDSPRVKQAGDTRVVPWRDQEGKWLLADEVLVISLPERPDRRTRVRAAMERDRVRFRFVDGVRVTETDPEDASEVHLHSFKLAGGPQKFLRGVAGCRRAHLRCLEEAYAAGWSSLLLIEDDMQPVDGWLERYAAAVNELPRGWLQLYLSSSDYRRSEPVSANLHRLAGTYQTTAILYSAAGIEAAVKALRRSRYEIDVWMGNYLHPFGCSYAIRPGITFQKGGVSDIMSIDRGVTP